MNKMSKLWFALLYLFFNQVLMFYIQLFFSWVVWLDHQWAWGKIKGGLISGPPTGPIDKSVCSLEPQAFVTVNEPEKC